RNERLANKTPEEKVELKRRSPLVRHFQQFESTARNCHSPADDHRDCCALMVPLAPVPVFR
ncbi:hypothetical protein HAX54_015141, partial [Datura stramonium]|nr:hypothetical protein [Datura stramonium]